MVFLLHEGRVEPFPTVELAEREPDGLLAAGGDLSIERLLLAYRKGIFPWYGWEEPILWWSPDPRMVLFPRELHISRSLAKIIKKDKFKITYNIEFETVIKSCSKTRKDGLGTWIVSDVQNAYIDFHKAGHAHSVEAWLDGELVGGLYGVLLGRVFFGESMFSKKTDASKVAFVHLVKRLEKVGLEIMDCQVYSQHLESLGARMIKRKEFANLLDEHCDRELDNEFVISHLE